MQIIDALIQKFIFFPPQWIKSEIPFTKEKKSSTWIIDLYPRFANK